MTFDEAKKEAQEIANVNNETVFVCASRHGATNKDYWTVGAKESAWMMGDDATIVSRVRPATL